MPEYRQYGTHQNKAEGAMTANALVGEPAGSVRAEQANPDFSPATMFSTAPYVPPKEPRGGYCCKGKDNTCMAAPIKGTDYCVFHTQKKKVSGEPPDPA